MLAQRSCSLNYYGEVSLLPRLCRVYPSLPALSAATGRAVCGLGCAVSIPPSLLSQLLRGGARRAVYCLGCALSIPPSLLSQLLRGASSTRLCRVYPSLPALSTTTGRAVCGLGCAVSVPPSLLSQLLRGGPSAASAVPCLPVPPCSLNYYGEESRLRPRLCRVCPSLPALSTTTGGSVCGLGCTVSARPGARFSNRPRAAAPEDRRPPLPLSLSLWSAGGRRIVYHVYHLNFSIF